MNDKLWFLVRVFGKVPNTRHTLSLASNFCTGLKIKPKKGASSNRCIMVMRYHIKSVIFINKSIEVVSNKNMCKVGDSFSVVKKHLLSHKNGTYLL